MYTDVCILSFLVHGRNSYSGGKRELYNTGIERTTRGLRQTTYYYDDRRVIYLNSRRCEREYTRYLIVVYVIIVGRKSRRLGTLNVFK